MLNSRVLLWRFFVLPWVKTFEMLNSRVPIQVLVTQPDPKTSTLWMELAQVPKWKSKPWKKILVQVFFREQLWCNCVNIFCILFFMFHGSDLISWYSLFIFRFKSFLVRKYWSWSGLFPGQCWWVQVLTNLMSPSPTHPHSPCTHVGVQIFCMKRVRFLEKNYLTTSYYHVQNLVKFFPWKLF